MKSITGTLLVVAILALSMSQFPRSVSAAQFVPIPVKVVIVGFNENQIDASYLAWHANFGNLPDSIANVDLTTGNATGVVFHPEYNVTFASSSFTQTFETYLSSIGKDKLGKNPWFSYYTHDSQNPDYYNQVPSNINYVVYDANSVEEWLWGHAQDVGGFPTTGWTLVVSYLPQLPSISWSDTKAYESSNGDTLPKSKPHYYGINHTDIDLGYSYRYRDFMNAWGGHHRMWFVDFSAGPVWNSQWEDLPLQAALGDNNINISSSFGKQWLTEYVSDYIYQATQNFIAQNFVYNPQYASKYVIDIFILDDRTSDEKKLVSIQSTVNKNAILEAYQDLVPYSQVAVNLSFPEVPNSLHSLIQASYKYTDSWLMGAVFASPERYGIVDLRPIYKYMLDNSATFEPSTHTHVATSGFDPSMINGTLIIPVFAFAFSNETYFSFTYKRYIGDRDWETGALTGEALPEAAFVSVNQWMFTRGDHVTPYQPTKGEGFTQTIIHEVGHEFGLMHPHQYGDIGDFIFSPMGYFTDDYKFGQIDKDSIQRAHVDQIRMETEKLLNQFPPGSAIGDQIRSKLSDADSAYLQTRYSDAMPQALAAYRLAIQSTSVQTAQTQSTATTAPTYGTPVTYLIAGIVAGLALGLGAAMLLKKKRTSARS